MLIARQTSAPCRLFVATRVSRVVRFLLTVRLGYERTTLHQAGIEPAEAELVEVGRLQALCLNGELASCEPKTLRYRLLHTAARLAFHARRATLRLQASWPWAGQHAVAFARLQALPPPAS